MIFGCTSSMAELEPFEPDHADAATRAPIRGGRAEGAEPDDAEVVSVVGTAQRGTLAFTAKVSYAVIDAPLYCSKWSVVAISFAGAPWNGPETCIVRGSIGSGESVWSESRGRSSAGRAPALQAGGRRFESARLHQLVSCSG
jgi:hypothetical protein